MANINKIKKLHIKSGDNVMIISGDHKGELAVVKKIYPKNNIPSRISRDLKDNKSVRVSKKTKEVIE